MIRWTIRFSLALFLGAATSTLARIPIDQDDLLEDAGVFSPNWFAEMQKVKIQGDFAAISKLTLLR